jgi:DNA-binding Xre family transcriptional regulator
MQHRMRKEEFPAIGKVVDAAMSSRGLTNVALERELGIDESTVRKVRYGQKASFDSYAKVCGHLGLSLEKILNSVNKVDGVSPAHLGSYSRQAVQHYEGTYITIRPKYAVPETVKAYLTRIFWDTSLDCLRFEELDRRDDREAQTGDIYFPEGPQLFLMTITNGWVRTVQVSKLVAGNKSMRGMIASQFEESGGRFAPVIAPIVLTKAAGSVPADFIPGEFGPDHVNYKSYIDQLRKTMRDGYLRVAAPNSDA